MNEDGRNNKISDQLDPEVEALVWAEAEHMENRLGRSADAGSGHYYWAHINFADAFFSKSDVRVRDIGSLVLAGCPDTFDVIQPIVQEEFDIVVKSAGKKPERIIVYVGSQSVMEYNYRTQGAYPPPYAHAIAGGLSCYINADKIRFDLYGKLDLAMERAIRHEPRHAMMNGLLRKDGVLTMALSDDSVAYEALGGPVDRSTWDDVDDVIGVDFDPLESGVCTFSDWYNRNLSQVNSVYRHVPFFENPIAKAFYGWVASKQREEGSDYWFKRAGIVD